MVPKRDLRAIVFDLDGLMVDTEPLSKAAWVELLHSFGHELPDELYAQVVGLRTDQTAVLFQEKFNLAISPKELKERKQALWETRWRKGVPAMPGLHELHAEVARRRIPWAVATSSPRNYAEHVLRHLTLWPTRGAIAAGDEVVNGKPAPDIYLLAAERLGISPEQCLALEDSRPGSQAALAAGMYLAAVPSGTTSKADVAFAPLICDSLDEVRQHLDRWFSP